jgi:RNA ligase
MTTPFETFPKIPRLYRECIVTEKIDGTNAQVVIPDDPNEPLLVGSRNRWITPGKTTDNYGFAEFVYNNEQAIRRLGPGKHFGEW